MNSKTSKKEAIGSRKDNGLWDQKYSDLEVNYSPLTGGSISNYDLLMYSSIFVLVTTPAVLTA